MLVNRLCLDNEDVSVLDKVVTFTKKACIISLVGSPGTMSKQNINMHYQTNVCKPYMQRADGHLWSEDLAQHDCETSADLQVVGVSVLLV